MKILSPFKQPYDALLRSSQDEYFWNRASSTQKNVNAPFSSPPINYSLEGGYSAEEVVFIINNKAIPIIFLTEYEKNNFSLKAKIVRQFAYGNYTSFKECPLVRWSRFTNYESSKIFEFFKQKDKEYLIDVPIACVSFQDYNYKTDIELNPQIANAFFAVMKPHEIYHEVMYWFNNKTNTEKPMVEVANDVRVQQHGFDKMSFRKRK